MDVCLPTTLPRHFALRLKQYLLFLEVTNDYQLVQLLMNFLPLHDLLRFLSLSSHFASFKAMQSVELRILRAKLSRYEKPEVPIGWDPRMHLIVYMAQPEQKKIGTLKQEHKNVVKLGQQLKMTKAPHKAPTSARKQKNVLNISEEQFRKQENRLEQQLRGELAAGWSRVSADQYFFKEYRDASRKSKSHGHTHASPPKKPQTSSLDLIEHHHARIDYERRKARRIQENINLMPILQLKELAANDPFSRQAISKLQMEQKVRQQQENIAKLRMPPCPDISKITLEPAQVKVVKQSIAGKMVSGIKSLLAIDRLT